MASSTVSTPQRARDWRPLFLAAFRNSANVRASAQAAGIERSTVYKARKREAEFAAAWDSAEQEALDLLEAKAMQMALSGDTQLLIFLLKTRRPEKYRDNLRLEGRIENVNLSEGLDDHERTLLSEAIRGELARRADERTAEVAVGTTEPPGPTPAAG